VILHTKLFKKLSVNSFELTIPTLLTLFRFVLVPFVVFSMIRNQWGVAFWLFVIAVLSDIFDGIIARAWNMKTFLGACLDAIADKFLILSVFFTLAFVQSPLFTIPLWFVLLVLLKEFLLIGGAAFIFLTRGSLPVEPTWLGKSTMVMQSLFIIWLFFCYFFHWVPERTYYGFLGVLLTLVLLSLINYSMIGFSLLKR
jgi:cardiolipin synthase